MNRTIVAIAHNFPKYINHHSQIHVMLDYTPALTERIYCEYLTMVDHGQCFRLKQTK